jgi:Sulfotransferase family
VNPYVFFVGCPRSGTTLLRRIADAHPQLAVVHESRWIPRTFEHRLGLTPEGFVTSKLLARLLREPKRLRALEMSGSELQAFFADHDSVHFSDFVSALFDFYGERHGKHLVGDKSPGYVRYLPLLHDLWPETKFVHIIRDGRDVYLSVLDWRRGATTFSSFDEAPATTAGVWWDWYVRLGIEGGRLIGSGLYCEVRYEALVLDAERELARVCDFLRLPYEAAMLRFHEGRMRDDPRLDAKRAWRPVTGGLRSWREQMPHEDVAQFEAAAGDLLEELGYERAATSLPKAELRRAADVRKRFADELHAGERPLPRAWLEAA